MRKNKNYRCKDIILYFYYRRGNYFFFYDALGGGHKLINIAKDTPKLKKNVKYIKSELRTLREPFFPVDKDLKDRYNLNIQVNLNK